MGPITATNFFINCPHVFGILEVAVGLVHLPDARVFVFMVHAGVDCRGLALPDRLEGDEVATERRQG